VREEVDRKLEKRMNDEITQKMRRSFSLSVCLPLTVLTTNLPSIQTLATSLLADIMLLRLFTAHTLPYSISVLGLEDLFFILEL
jgi:hypothetical protein